jgi:hypothetical protein
MRKPIDKKLIKEITPLIDLEMSLIPPSKFKTFDKWVSELKSIDKKISLHLGLKLYGGKLKPIVPIVTVKEIRNKLYNSHNIWRNHIDSKIKEICPSYSGKAPWTFDCLCCGSTTETKTRGQIVRIFGLLGNEGRRKETIGFCTSCAWSASRDWSNVTQDYRDVCTLRSYNRIHGTNYTDVSQIPYTTKRYKNYRKSVVKSSKRQLKKHNPHEYERYMSNKYDGTDLNKLTIEHIKEVNECFKEGLSVKETSDISNLEVITMRENILRYNPNAKI